MHAALDHPNIMRDKAIELRASIRERFTVSAMAEAITDFYAARQQVRKVA